MFKYIFIAVVAFGAYKGFYKSGAGEINSSEYKFQVVFPEKPKEKQHIIDVPEYGKFQLTSYSHRKAELACAVLVSSYLEFEEIPGDVYDQIRVAKRQLLEMDGVSINKEEFIFSGSVSGYQFDLSTQDNKLLQTRIFTYHNNSYNLTCQYDNTNEYKAKANKFMDSFAFI